MPTNSITYNLLTGVTVDRIYDHLKQKQLISTNQKVCKRNSLGTKDHIFLNKAIMKNAKKYNKNLYMAWIDYKKVYNSISHCWINKLHEIL